MTSKWHRCFSLGLLFSGQYSGDSNNICTNFVTLGLLSRNAGFKTNSNNHMSHVNVKGWGVIGEGSGGGALRLVGGISTRDIIEDTWLCKANTKKHHTCELNVGKKGTRCHKLNNTLYFICTYEQKSALSMTWLTKGQIYCCLKCRDSWPNWKRWTIVRHWVAKQKHGPSQKDDFWFLGLQKVSHKDALSSFKTLNCSYDTIKSNITVSTKGQKTIVMAPSTFVAV